jgi:hypothetical protein
MCPDRHVGNHTGKVVDNLFLSFPKSPGFLVPIFNLNISPLLCLARFHKALAPTQKSLGSKTDISIVIKTWLEAISIVMADRLLQS